MNVEEKTLKQYCKEAKNRLKNGFWQDYKRDLDLQLERAEKQGISTSKVKEYYTQRIAKDIKNSQSENEEFYQKVKEMLDTEGEVSNAIGRLTDKEEFEKLSYEEKQRYTLQLSEKYVKAVERYNTEKSLLLSQDGVNN